MTENSRPNMALVLERKALVLEDLGQVDEAIDLLRQAADQAMKALKAGARIAKPAEVVSEAALESGPVAPATEGREGSRPP